MERDATSWLLYLAVGLLLTLLWAKYTNNLEPIQKLFNKLLTQGSSVKQPT